MPASLEARRRAVADALRAVATEPDPARATVILLPLELPARTADEEPTDRRVSVPTLSLDGVRMSAVAAEALFGG